MNEEQTQQAVNNVPTPVRVINNETLLIVGVVALLLGGILGYVAYPMVNAIGSAEPVQTEGNVTVSGEGGEPASAPSSDVSPTEQQEVGTETNVENSPTSTGTTSALREENPFCKEYGTAVISKKDLLETYTIGPGETLRDVAAKVLDDETKATEIITANPMLYGYEIDDQLPMGLEIFIPNAKYTGEGITSYIRTKGNITFNETKPMFGVTAPNSGTGPFIISDDIKTDIEGIVSGDCVVVIYGSIGYDPNKIVLEVKAQQ